MSEQSRGYIRALRFRRLTKFYDPVLRLVLKEERFKRLLVEQAGILPSHRVLDLGCDTGTLTIMLKRAQPSATIVGLDGDAEILRIARQKVVAAGLDIALHEGVAFAPPFEPESFDRVVSSLLFHHRVLETNAQALRSVEAYAELRNLVFFQLQDTLVKIDTQYRQAVLFRDLIVPRAWQTVEVSTSAYQAGSLDFTTLIDNWRNWLDFSLDYQRALADLEQRFADLQQQIGLRVPRSAVAATGQTVTTHNLVHVRDASGSGAGAPRGVPEMRDEAATDGTGSCRGHGVGGGPRG